MNAHHLKSTLPCNQVLLFLCNKHAYTLGDTRTEEKKTKQRERLHLTFTQRESPTDMSMVDGSLQSETEP